MYQKNKDTGATELTTAALVTCTLLPLAGLAFGTFTGRISAKENAAKIAHTGQAQIPVSSGPVKSDSIELVQKSIHTAQLEQKPKPMGFFHSSLKHFGETMKRTLKGVSGSKPEAEHNSGAKK